MNSAAGLWMKYSSRFRSGCGYVSLARHAVPNSSSRLSTQKSPTYYGLLIHSIPSGPSSNRWWLANPFCQWSVLASSAPRFLRLLISERRSVSGELSILTSPWLLRCSFRPEESIFNIRCWADGVDPPEGAKKVIAVALSHLTQCL